MPDHKHEANRSYALIIAADTYADRELGELRSPSRDAEEFGRVLEDPAIGDFNVQALVNQPGDLVREEIEGFFADRLLDDLLILYLSCHGVKDASGRLYFASATTKLRRLAASGISSDFVYEQVDRCRARRILLLLDCCYSGAYLKGHRARSGDRAAIRSLDGRGRAVITSSTALEYSFEIDTGHFTGTPAPSIFTAALIEGLRTGDADGDGDGLISIDDLYGYVYARVREVTPYQTPEKKWGDIRGDFIIARSPHAATDQREPLPQKLTLALQSPFSRVREAAILELATIALGGIQGLALSARDALQSLAEDDNFRVSTAAMAALSESPVDALTDNSAQETNPVGTGYGVASESKTLHTPHRRSERTGGAQEEDSAASRDPTEQGVEEESPGEATSTQGDPNQPNLQPATDSAPRDISADEKQPALVTADHEARPQVEPASAGSTPNGWLRRKYFGRTAVVTATVAVLITLMALIIRSQTPHVTDYTGDGTGSVTVQLAANDTAGSMAQKLVRLGVIKTASNFIVATRSSQAFTKLKPGYYRLHHHMSAKLALRSLMDPASRINFAVVPGNLRLTKTLSTLAAKFSIPVHDFIEAARDTRKLGLPSYARGKLEGYLYPSSYPIQPGMSATRVLQDMVARFNREAASINLSGGAASLNLTERQVVIVASLVQAEASGPRYYGRIARLIYNRLKDNVNLNLNSTVLYALNKTSLPLTSSQVHEVSPYNTYLHQGLPPGPIGNPGAAALEATLHPAKGNWLYFVVTNAKKGTTRFTADPGEYASLEAATDSGILSFSCQIIGYPSVTPRYAVGATVGSGASYAGSVIVSFSSPSAVSLPSTTLNPDVTVTYDRPWYATELVPSPDQGASFQPSSCFASAGA